MSDQGNENSEQLKDAIYQRKQTRRKRKFNERLVQNSEQLEGAIYPRKQARRKRNFNEPLVQGSAEYILAQRCANCMMEVLFGGRSEQEDTLVDSSSLGGDQPTGEVASGSGTKHDALICDDEY